MIYKVGTYKIDTLQFDLSCDEESLAIEPRVFDLIVYLIERRGRLVSREEIFESLWNGREVSDTSLSNCIKAARNILGDNGEKQAVIKTIRGRGYQFVAVTKEIPDQDKLTPVEERSEKSYEVQNQANGTITASEKLSHSKFSKISKANLFVLSVGLLLIFYYLIGNNLKNEHTSRPYVLVVPFEFSGENQQKWQPLADQMTKEVIRSLRKISGLDVIPASSAFTFKNNKTHEYIKGQLPGVRYILSANVNMGQDMLVQVNSELDDLEKGKLIWDDKFQSRIDNTTFFTIQSEIATAVSKSLSVVIREKEKLSLGELPTSNLRAYEHYVAGQQQKDLLTHKSLNKAIDYYHKAIELDPEFELAYVALADAYRIIMVYFDKPSEVLPKVTDAVAKTLKINSNSAEARSSLGLAYVYAWRWQDGWEMLKQAKEINPNLALTELGFALYYSGLGDVEAVRNSIHLANQIDPLNIELADWGIWALAMVGDVDKAVKWGEQKLQLHPEVGLIHSSASMAASLKEDHERSISLAKKGVELDAGVSYPLLALAQAYAHAGELEKVPSLLKQVESFDSYLCDYETAVTHLLLKDLDKAFEHFNKAIKNRSNCLIFSRYDPRLKPIRDDRRYKAILTRVGLDDRAIKNYPK